MIRKLLLLSLVLMSLLPAKLFSQARRAFSGDPLLFTEELTAFMGPNLNDEQKNILFRFTSDWDSALFSIENSVRIINLSVRMEERQTRAIPHYIEFLKTLNSFLESDNKSEFIGIWLQGFQEMLSDENLTQRAILQFIQNTNLTIKENILTNTGSVTWKIKNGDLTFALDTALRIDVKEATLTCYSQRDSTEIYDVTGSYLPFAQIFRGKKGIVTWEKAGYPGNEVFAEMTDFAVNTSRNSFVCDSARLVHNIYFKEPVYGILSDQATGISSPAKATFPRFETYTGHFKIRDMYKGVDYEGGLAFEGANVKGKGENNIPALITLSRNDTLYFRIASMEFMFSINGITSMETAATLYLDNDSVHHTNLGFSYNAGNRQVNLYRTSNPVSRSPYFNSYHNLDMYFDYLSWDMGGRGIIISRARGAALGEALFESGSFFNSDYFLKLMGLDDYHPLTRLKHFSEWYYSETFPVEEFAKWLNKPEETVTGLCIDMANRGFVFYDRTSREVTIKKKLYDFIDSFAGRKDYDIISIYSETKAPQDNAVLDLSNFNLTVNGVSRVFLSDSQNVAIYPYKRQLVIGKNRNIKFDGIVQAGLFTFYGHEFSFVYDTFKLNLRNIDSIKIAVESDKRDHYGNYMTERVDNLIQLATAEVYIDDPDNKSGLRGLEQYPIVNATNPSYIFFDKIPGLEDIYKKDDFYFKVNPFTYENIDHYKIEDLSLEGEFRAGNILSPLKQYLTIQDDKSLGFKMTIPDEGLEIYEGEGRLYDSISMSNKGLIGRGSLKHLSSTAISTEFRLFPDSMLTQASTFDMSRDASGLYPDITSQDVAVKWLTREGEWLAENSKGKQFDMFGNGTTLDGSLKLTRSLLMGEGVINTTDSRVTSGNFTFRSNAIKADTADYFFKSPSTSGYSFIAENANTDINFDDRMSRLHLNTDSSVVKFPELEYICTMTDFVYDMDEKVLNMEHREKRTGQGLMPPDRLIRLRSPDLEKPTFFSTNSLNDTIAFSSLKARYFVDKEYAEAEDINYIPVADALIQPENGRITIGRRARIDKLENAVVAVNNRHILHSANINIVSSKRYTGNAVYNYTDDSDKISRINFPEITVDTLTTTARGFIPEDQNFMLNAAFTFTGDVMLSARSDRLLFTGAAGIVHDCRSVPSNSVKFSSEIDPENVLIPVGDKPRDKNDNLVLSGSFVNIDSSHIYPSFLSHQKSWADAQLVKSRGFLYYDKAKGTYNITSLEKIADPLLSGDIVTFDKINCSLTGEGTLNFGADLDHVNLTAAGNYIHQIDSSRVTISAMLAFDFHFLPEALQLMTDEIRIMPSLKPVNVNTPFYTKSLRHILGTTASVRMKKEMDLFGSARVLPEGYAYELLLNDVNLYWNELTSSFRSTGRIGIGFIGSQAVNLYVDGYIEIQRRRSGDMVDIYLKADRSTWYYFSYFRGVMMAQAGNNNFNTLLSKTKLKQRRHPQFSVRKPYTYMIAVEDRLGRFLKRMEASDDQGESGIYDGLTR